MTQLLAPSSGEEDVRHFQRAESIFFFFKFGQLKAQAIEALL